MLRLKKMQVSLETVQNKKTERDEVFIESMKVLRENPSINKGVLSRIRERN